VNKPFENMAKCAINEAGPKVRQHHSIPNRNQHIGGARMADKPNMGIPPSKSISQWKSIGNLAAELVVKAKAGDA